MAFTTKKVAEASMVYLPTGLLWITIPVTASASSTIGSRGLCLDAAKESAMKSFVALACGVVVLLAGLPAYWWIIKDRSEPASKETLYAHENV